MPELIEQMYCSQQIIIPPKFPYILKRYCKAAIKTQPYDLLRWSFEYFKALAEKRPPPVKLRLEYPVFSTEGGLTRGCLKVLANQLSSQQIIPLTSAKAAWQGFCLDPEELRRIFCLCGVYIRADTVPFLNFIAVSAGLLTKSLTHTMILLCETLTKEPDGGSAAIPVQDFIIMYQFLARIDASKDVKYFNGYREGRSPPSVEVLEVEEPTLEIIPDSEVAKLKAMSAQIMGSRIDMPKDAEEKKSAPAPVVEEDVNLTVEIHVFDEDDNELEFEFYGEPKDSNEEGADKEQWYEAEKDMTMGDGEEEEQTAEDSLKEKILEYVKACYEEREERLLDLMTVFDEIAAIADKAKSANYDLGMVAGRQMSITSGEFIVQHIEKEIMDYINEQIAILPDPDMKKKKAKPEEVQMIRELLLQFIDESIDVIVPEYELVEDEEEPIPDVVTVFAVPGIGPAVDEDIIQDVVDYAMDVCKVQADLFMPRNIRHFMCPPLEKFVEYNYEDKNEKKP